MTRLSNLAFAVGCSALAIVGMLAFLAPEVLK